MPKAPWIIILGAGYGGLTVAKQLDNYLKDHPNTMQVVLVDRNHSMTIGKANQFALAGRSVPMQVCCATKCLPDVLVLLLWSLMPWFLCVVVLFCFFWFCISVLGY